MSNIEPDEDGNYTEQQWDSLSAAERMRLCASGEYDIVRSDMTDAAVRIEKLEAALQEIIDNPKRGRHWVNLIATMALEGKDD
jgi:hypothetical protein